jgi:hypothetical protein
MSKMMEYYTGLNTYQIVEEFERELAQEKHGEFYEWVEDNFDGLFTKETELLHRACDEFIKSDKGRDADLQLRRARARYFKTLIDKLPEYRRSKGVDESVDFINSFIKG